MFLKKNDSNQNTRCFFSEKIGRNSWNVKIFRWAEIQDLVGQTENLNLLAPSVKGLTKKKWHHLNLHLFPKTTNLESKLIKTSFSYPKLEQLALAICKKKKQILNHITLQGTITCQNFEGREDSIFRNSHRIWGHSFPESIH